MLQYEIYSTLLSNKIAQENSQPCTKLHNELYNEVNDVLHNKNY